MQVDFQPSKADYVFRTTARSGRIVLRGIRCSLYLPKRRTGPVKLLLLLTKGQHSKFHILHQFSIHAAAKNMDGGKTIFKATTVYRTELSTTHRGQGMEDRIARAEPADLKITYVVPAGRPSFSAKPGGALWLTPSRLLTPAQVIGRAYTGEVTVETAHQTEFKLRSGMRLAFAKHYDHETNETGETVATPHLVAEYELPSRTIPTAKTYRSLVEEVDDVLLLVSFAERQACVCVGWEATTPRTVTRFYRRDITIRKDQAKNTIDDFLIERRDFEDFINAAHSAFARVRPRDVLRYALRYVIPREGLTVENSFVRFYTALETVLALVRRRDRLETVLPRRSWTQIRNDLKQWLRTRPEFARSRRRLDFVYEKVGELNRVSFASAFRRFCEVYSVQTDDLWPVVGDPGQGLPLSGIRNALVHGRYFNPPEFEALFTALMHLQWVVERSLLAVLGWPASRSDVSSSALGAMKHYRGWQEHRKRLKG